MSILRALLLLTLLVGFLTGCSEGHENRGDSDKVSLEPITFSQWSNLLAQYSPDIVVVDMWATWCAPCVERFPGIVELDRRYRNQGVRVVSMLLEDRGDSDAIRAAKRFLVENNATFENYYIDENLLDAFESLDLIGIPAVVIYDRKSQERYRLTGDNPNRQFDESDVENAIIALLKESI